MSSEQIALALLVVGLVLIGVVIIASVLAAAPSPTTAEAPVKSEPPPLPKEESGVLEDLDRLGQAAQIRASEEAKLRPWLRPIGFVARLMTYAALFWLLYIWAPKEDIFNRPLGSLTLSDLAGTIFLWVVAIVLVRALFSPSDNEQIKDAWGWLGVLILAGTAIGALFLFNVR